MYGLVIGCCAVSKFFAYKFAQLMLLPQAILPEEQEAMYQTPFLLDPSADEDSRIASGLVSLACIPAMGTVTNLSIQGQISRSATKEVR